MKALLITCSVLFLCFSCGPLYGQDKPPTEEKPSSTLQNLFGNKEPKDNKGTPEDPDDPCPDRDHKEPGDGTRQDKKDGIFCPVPGQEGKKHTAKPVPEMSLGRSVKLEPKNSTLSSQVGKVVAGHRKHINQCYDQRLEKNWELAGRIVFIFTVQPDGSVSDISTTGDTTGDTELADCAAKIIGKLRFPPPGWLVKVTYPILFLSSPAPPSPPDKK